MTVIIPYGMRTGLGQGCPAPDAVDCGIGVPNPIYAGSGDPSSLTTILGAIQKGATTADTAFNQYLNAQTQQSLIQAQLQRSLLTPLASLTGAGSLSSLMPLLLIGGGLVVVIMLARKLIR